MRAVSNIHIGTPSPHCSPIGKVEGDLVARQSRCWPRKWTLHAAAGCPLFGGKADIDERSRFMRSLPSLSELLTKFVGDDGHQVLRAPVTRCKSGHFKGDHDAAHADMRPPKQRNRLALQAGVRTKLRNSTISSAFSLKATKNPTMRAHSLIVLVSAALVAAGVIGLGAHIYNYSRAPVTEVEPLFARSVEQAGLPASHWRTERLDVPYYGPMVELLTLGASASRATTDQRQPATAPASQERRAPAGAEQTRQSRRAKAGRSTMMCARAMSIRETHMHGETLRKRARTAAVPR